jgi:hypothetical protein
MKKVLGAMAGILFSVFCIAILGLLMSFTYGGLKKLFPDSFNNQIWGMVVFDIAAMIWGLAFVFKSHSVLQYAASGIGFATGFLGTLLMVTFEVLTSGQTYVADTYNIGQWAVYGFIIVTAIHAALVYLHHAGAPDIHEKINIGIARGEITTEAIRQATQVLEQEKAQLANSIHAEIVNQVKRDLNIPILADSRMPIIPAEPIQYAPVQPTPTPQKQSSLFEKWKEGFFKKNPPPSPVRYEQVIPQVKTTQEDPGQGNAPFQE